MEHFVLKALLVAVSLVFCNGEDAAEHIKGPGKLPTRPGEFPYFALIMREDSRDTMFGSGILLRPNVVLTIGRAIDDDDVEPEDLVVLLGAHDRSEEENSQQEIEVDSIEISDDGWIALLHLAQTPELGKRVKTFGVRHIASLYEEEMLIRNPPDDCVVPGYGAVHFNKFNIELPKRMKKFNPQIRMHGVCLDVYGPERYHKTEMICTRNTDTTSVCVNDNDVPLFCSDSGDRLLYGMAIGTDDHCSTGISIFIRTSNYIDWIKITAHRMQYDLE